MQLKKYNRFGRNGCYVCEMCKKSTRDTGNDEAGANLCKSCYDECMNENFESDNRVTLTQNVTINPEYVVCETDVAIVLHIRRGNYRPCGKQDTLTLCGMKPAWDTEIKIIDSETRACRECLRFYKQETSNEKAI